jgi:cell division transport system permease protein
VKAVAARLRYFATDAMDEWRHSPGVNLLASATLAAALFLGGLVQLVLNNVDTELRHWRADLTVQVYLLSDVSQKSTRRIERVLGGLAEVSRVQYVSKDEALELFHESGSLAGLLVELEANPLPASFEVYLAPEAVADEAARRVAETAAGLPGVEEVRFDREFLDRLQRFLQMARLGGGLLSIVVFSAVVLVMASVLRLAVYARRDEIEIMQLVGATPAFIRGPFLVAGLAQGLVAALVAVGMIEAARRGLFWYVGTDPVALLSMMAGRSLSWTASATLAFTGLTVSFIGAWFAVRRTT